jgi:hypothetical protein
MTDPVRRPTGVGRDHESARGARRWVKLIIITAAVVALLVVAVMLIGGGGHRPRRHGGDGGQPSPFGTSGVVFRSHAPPGHGSP